MRIYIYIYIQYIYTYTVCIYILYILYIYIYTYHSSWNSVYNRLSYDTNIYYDIICMLWRKSIQIATAPRCQPSKGHLQCHWTTAGCHSRSETGPWVGIGGSEAPMGDWELLSWGEHSYGSKSQSLIQSYGPVIELNCWFSIIFTQAPWSWLNKPHR